MRFRFLYIKGALISGLVYIIPPAATGAEATGSFSIYLAKDSPIVINNRLTGLSDEKYNFSTSKELPVWLSFSSARKFILPAGITLGGEINGTITSTNRRKGSSHIRDFKIDMASLDNTLGPGELFRWPDRIAFGETYQFYAVISLTGSVTVTNSTTNAINVPGAPFQFKAHNNEIVWDMSIFGKVPAKSTCTLTLSQSAVSLGEIGFAQLSSAAPESRLEGMNKTVNVVTQCTRTQSAKLKLQTTGPLSVSNCAKGSGFSMSFCAESGGYKININGNTFNVISSDLSTGHATEINFYATKGYGDPTVGAVTAAITIIASPE